MGSDLLTIGQVAGMPRPMTEADVAHELGVSVLAVRELPLAYVKDGRTKLYMPREIERYLASTLSLGAKLRRIAKTYAQDADGYVYFFQCISFVKIGYSRAPKTRLERLRVANPHNVEFLCALRGRPAMEAAIHRLLASRHHRLEWFHLDVDLLSAIHEAANV